MRLVSQLALALAILAISGRTTAHAQWQSQIAQFEEGRLRYEKLGLQGDQIPDFSYAGYRNGQEIPSVQGAFTVEVRPDANSPTAGIQDGIDRASAWLEANGAEGDYAVVQLSSGTYTVTEPVRLNASHVVVRGTGDESDPAANTIISAVGDATFKRVLVVGSGLWATYEEGRWLAGGESRITDYVQAGQLEIPVKDASIFSVGNHVLVSHPCTQEWLDTIDGGGVSKPWTCLEENGQPRRELFLTYDRYVTSIDRDDNVVTLDAPVYHRFKEAVDAGTAVVSVIDEEAAKIVREVGVEDLRVAISFDASRDSTACGSENRIYYTDEDHPVDAILFVGAENGWVRGVTTSGFSKAGVEFRNATRVTVERTRAIEPASLLKGSRRYHYHVSYFGQLILVRDSYARDARHAYVLNGGATSSGVVFLRTVAEGSITFSESHSRWSQGILYDQHIEVDPNTCNNGPFVMGLHNRGDACRTRPTLYCNYHGWSATNSVVWNSDMADGVLVLNDPPIGQNYAIGVRGAISAENYDTKGKGQPLGYVEGQDRRGLRPESLYEAQLADRLRRAQE